MDGSPDDERRRRLQRIAYGADASPEERAAAEAELHALADAAANDPPQPVEEAHGDPTAPPTPQPDEARTTSSTGRWAIGAGVAALVVGLAVGTQLPGLITADPSTPGADAGRRAGDAPDASLITGPGTPVEHTPVYEVFDREQRPSDALPADMVAGTGLEPSSPRLLVTRSDGVGAYAALTLDGDLCVVMVVDAVGGGSACTDQRVLPPEGLIATFGFNDRPAISVSLHPDGTVGLSPAEQPTAD